MAQFYDQMAALNVLANVGQDEIATGSITTQNLNPNSGTATAGSTVALTGLNGVSSVTIQVTGTYTGALTIQGSVDGVNWVAIGAVYNTGTLSITGSISSAVTGIVQVATTGLPNIRVSANAAVTGTAVVTMEASTGSGVIPKTAIMGQGFASLDGAVNSTAPTNVLWETPAPTTVTQNACSIFSLGALTTSNVKASAGNVYGLSIFNPAAATTFLQFYNTSGTPTLGTGVLWAIGVAAGATVSLSVGPFSLWNASTGIGVGAATTATGSGVPATAPTVTIFYR